MQYYIQYPDEVSPHSDDIHFLGEMSFDNFWTGTAYPRFKKLVTEYESLVDKVTIRNDKNEVLDASEFVDILSKSRIIE